MSRGMRSIVLILVVALFGTMVAPVAMAAPASQQAQYATPVAIVNTSFLNVRTGPGVQYSVLITVVGGTTLQVMGRAADGVWLQVSTQAGLGWVNVEYTIPRGNFEFVPVVSAPKVVTPETAPQTSYSGTTTQDDTAVDAGFSSTRLWGASLRTTQTARISPSANALPVQDFGASDGIIYKVVNATFAEGIPWVQLEFSPTQVGWVDQAHVLFRPYGCGYTVVRMTHDTQLQKGPDGSGTETGITGGHEAYLLDRVGNSFKIELQSGVFGWADVSTISIRDEATVSKPPCIGSAAVQQEQGQGGAGQQESAPAAPGGVAYPYVVVNTGYLNIRSGAGVQYQPVATVPGGTRLHVIATAGDGIWYLVEGPFGQGWLNIEYVLFRGDGRNLPISKNVVGTVAQPVGRFNATVTLYAAPNLTLGVVGTLQGPGEVTVIGQSVDGNWVQVSSSIGNGWVQRILLTITGNTASLPIIN